MVIEDVSVLLASTDLPAAHALGLDRVRFLNPIANIEIVNMLLTNVVAAKPREEIPVSHLVFQFRQITAVEWLLGWVSTIPITAEGHEVANSAVANLLNRIEIGRLVAALQ